MIIVIKASERHSYLKKPHYNNKGNPGQKWKHFSKGDWHTNAKFRGRMYPS